MVGLYVYETVLDLAGYGTFRHHPSNTRKFPQSLQQPKMLPQIKKKKKKSLGGHNGIVENQWPKSSSLSVCVTQIH